MKIQRLCRKLYANMLQLTQLPLDYRALLDPCALWTSCGFSAELHTLACPSGGDVEEAGRIVLPTGDVYIQELWTSAKLDLYLMSEVNEYLIESVSQEFSPA